MTKINDDQWAMGSAIHGAERALRMISVLLDRTDIEETARARRLEAVLEEFGEIDPCIGPVDFPLLRVAADRLHEVLVSDRLENLVAGLNQLLLEYAHPPRLTAHDQSLWHLHIDSHDDAPWDEWFVTSSCMAFAILIAEKQRVPTQSCASPRCRRLFLDVGQGGPRYYCSSRCATRERVATYRRNKKSRPKPL